MHKAAHAYMQTNVATKSPGEIIIMLYDGAIKFLNQAKEKIAEKDYAAKGIAISKTMDILNELSSVLNKEKGGELADNLNKLYFWCNTRLAMANLKMDITIIDSVISVLAGLRSAYAQIQNNPEVIAVCEQLSSKQNMESHVYSRSNSVPRVEVQTAPQPGANMRARNLYNKMALNQAS